MRVPKLLRPFRLLSIVFMTAAMLSSDGRFAEADIANVDLMARLTTSVPAPIRVYPRFGGGEFSLAERAGKYTVINFWALWCAPCLAEMPALGRMKSQLADAGVEVVAINLGDDHQAISRFLKRTNVSDLMIVEDRHSRANADWHLQGLPATFVVGPVGNITHAAFGAREWDDTDSIQWLKNSLGQLPLE